MKPYSSRLGRQIIRSVVVIAVGSVLMTIAASYLFYGILLRVDPEHMKSAIDSWLPSGIDWLIIGTLSALSAVISAFAAQGLAKRIIAPVLSVAEKARQIAGGDLTARAEPAIGSPSELSTLVEDFNLLAQRLELASQAVTQWNAMIAHELRTPVTILRGRLQGLADGLFAPEPQLLRSLETQAISLSRLIDDLRTVTLFDGGHLRADLREADLAEAVASTVEFMRPDLDQAGFEVVIEIAPIRCVADCARIRQALMALLENVKRHARPGPVVVTLERIGTQISLQVEDSGPGLPAAFEKHAFDPFQRYLENGGVMKGSGLGLSVVRAIAQIHGGTATYRRVDGGARFGMVFPG